QLGKHVRQPVGGERLFVFYDAQVFALYGRYVTAQLKRFGIDAVEMIVPRGERVKSAAVLNKVYEFLLSEKVSRTDFILACGGGVTSDLVGYAAATTLRGIRWGIVSTTLIGMVDAAIGGKTGINHAKGKNLIGAFWQPSFVFCDTSLLRTLPSRELIAGLGEVIKYGGLIGPKVIEVLDIYLIDTDLYNDRLLNKLVYFCASYKADVVAKDERESGLRVFLNLGHTFAHAIENAVGYGRLLHGEAVVLGLMAAVELSCVLNPQRSKNLSNYRRIIELIMHFIPYRKIDPDEVLRAMHLDKKRAGVMQRFILLEKPGRPIIVDKVSKKSVLTSMEKVLTVYRSVGGKYAANFGC
ncbi:MAG: 3-dehydroquinate synthase, partial [Candidatus Zixiibacteriota bacterium]